MSWWWIPGNLTKSICRLSPEHTCRLCILPMNVAFLTQIFRSLNEEFSDRMMAQVLCTIYSQKNLRPAPGKSEQLTQWTSYLLPLYLLPDRDVCFSFQEDVHGMQPTLYIDAKGQGTQWPQSLVVQVCLGTCDGFHDSDAAALVQHVTRRNSGRISQIITQVLPESKWICCYVNWVLRDATHSELEPRSKLSSILYGSGK